MRLGRFWRRNRRDEELRDELEAHLAHEADARVRDGLDESSARAAAARRLGNTTRIRETVYESGSLGWIESVARDLRYAVRVLRRSPGFAVAAIVSLALGIGANTAIFELLDALRLRSLPVERPGALAGGEPPLFRDGVVVDRLDGADHLLDAEPLVDEVMAGTADSLGELGVLKEPDDRSGQRASIARRDEEAGSAVVDHLGDAADGGGDDRTRQRHRLEDREALRLPPRRKDRDVQRGRDRRDVVPPPGEEHAIRNAHRGGESHERLRIRPFSDDSESRLGRTTEDGRHRLDEEAVPLFRLEARDDPKQRRR